MGNCICDDAPPRHRQFQGTYPTSNDVNRPPTFHHPQFRQFNDEQQQQMQLQQQQQHKLGGTPGLSGESTRIGGGAASAGTPLRRAPGQSPIAPIHDDIRTTVARPGNEHQATLLRTPRSAVSGRSTGRGGGTTTPRSGVRGNTTPRAGQQQRVANDPYDEQQHQQQQAAYEESDGDPDEMILICADCFVDVMAEGVPKKCPVTGKLHV